MKHCPRCKSSKFKDYGNGVKRCEKCGYVNMTGQIAPFLSKKAGV